MSGFNSFAGQCAGCEHRSGRYCSRDEHLAATCAPCVHESRTKPIIHAQPNREYYSLRGVPNSSSRSEGTLDKTECTKWKRIWSLPAPNKVRMFVWRVQHESLALRTNLIRRGMKLDDVKCLFCGRADEDGGHLFVKCKAVKVIWRGLDLEESRQKLEKIGSAHEMLDQIWSLDERRRVMILTFWWQWWSMRNKLREGELPMSADELIRRTKSHTIEYLANFSPKEKKRIANKWAPPGQDMIKLNLDGAFTPGDSFAGWGVVARDAGGDVIHARAGRCDNIHDAFGAELCAMSNAVNLAADIGAVRVEFETDSALLADVLDVRRVDSSAYAAIIEDVKYQMKVWFSKCRVLACNREANCAAHELARLGHSCNPLENLIWDSVVPAHVAAAVVGDMPTQYQ